jgi:hypothetical protein
MSWRALLEIIQAEAPDVAAGIEARLRAELGGRLVRIPKPSASLEHSSSDDTPPSPGEPAVVIRARREQQRLARLLQSDVPGPRMAGRLLR